MVNTFSIRYKLKYLINNFKKIIKLSYRVFVVLVKAIFSKKGLKRYLNRGYSTIEMQLIRTYGVVSGYEKTYLRKIYELIYANIFFKSYNNKTKYYHYLHNNLYLKYQIPYAYFKSVRTFINERVCKNMVEYYKYIRNFPKNRKISKNEEERIVYILSIEEIFIFILGLSMNWIDKRILEEYSYYIDKYELDVEKLTKIIDYIQQN